MIFLLSCFCTYAQSTIVRGVVNDQQGAPLPGVSVQLKGTATATATGPDGGYSINATSNGTLTFSFVGFNSQNVAINNQTAINITLQENVKSLNEVVVVGYGTQKKSVVTGAISSVKTSDIQDQQVTRVDQALQGRTSGVTVVQSSGAPGSAPTVRIRGITSRLNSDPLYVVDGVVILNGGIENINPNDIESIEVLKDASAAIYGSRSSNGVILVTTKKGRSGTPQITYNAYYGLQGPVKKVELADASQYAALRNQSLINDGGAALFTNPSSYGTGTNWQDQIFSNKARIQNHSLSISGGTDKSTYYTSFGYLDQQGIVEPSISNFKRFNATVNTSFKAKKWLTIGENASYAYVRNQNNLNTNSEFGGPLSSALNLDPITSTVITNLSGVPNPADYTSPYLVRDGLGRPYGISAYVKQEITNPLAYIQTQQGNYGWSHNLLGNAFVEIEPIKGFKIRSSINGKQAFYGSESFSPLFYLNSSTSNTSNTSQYRASNRNLTWNWDNTASYTRTIGLHNFTALVGTSAFEQYATYLGGTYIGEPVNTFNQASFNYALSNTNKIASGGEDQPYTVASYFGRLTYNYDEKYLLTGIVRRDGSSKFGSNNVYGTFPSLSLGWVATREKFFPENTFVDFLKIRGSYGVVGNEQALQPFQYTSTIGGGRNYIYGNDQLIVGYSPNAPANPDLKWEETHTTDLGFDAVVFKDFNVTFDLYRKLTKGMLQTITLPAYGGYAQAPSANVGDMLNKGVELELGYNKRLGDFGLNLNGNIAYNQNKVLSLGNTAYYTAGNVQSTAYEIGRIAPGQQLGAFYGFNELGVFHSQAEINAYTKNGTLIQPNAKPGDFKWEDINGDGKIDANDRKFLGDPLPHWTYGFTFGSSYKNFDLKVFGQGVWGNKIYQAYRRLDIPTANYPIESLNAWTPTNPASNYPRLTDTDPNNNFKNPSNFYLQNGAYFRIKTLQIGYTIPKALLTKADIQRIRIYVSSNNLATITPYKGFDPEISGGVDRGIYPQARTFMLGLDVTL